MGHKLRTINYIPAWADGHQIGTGRRDVTRRYKAITDHLDGRRDFRLLELGAYS
ncbi:unnamed protein product, partial [marine sediment metagenome]